MFIRHIMPAVCRIGLLSAVSLTVLPTLAAKAEPVILVFDLKIDTHNGVPLSQPTIMNNFLVRFDNTVTRTRTSSPAVTKWTYFDGMQETRSVPETPYTESLLAMNPGWLYQMGNDASGRQYFRVSGTTHPNGQIFSVAASAMANYTDPQDTNWFWLYFRELSVQESNVFSNEGEVGFFTSESLMALLQRALVNGYPFSFMEYSGFSNDLPDGAGSMSEIYEGIATLKFVAAVEVPLDIKPGSCPNPISLVAQGRIPVSILGTSEFDVTSVNLETLRLEGVPPLHYSYKDIGTPYYSANEYSDCYQCSALGGDGYQDLVLHFDARAIAQVLTSPGKRESGVMVLTGEKLDGTPFVARDVVKIVP